MARTREEAEEKLSNAFKNRTINLALGSEERKELLTQLLMSCDEDSIASSVYEAIEHYLKNQSKPSVEEMLKNLTSKGLPKSELEEKNGEAIEKIWDGYFGTPLQGKENAGEVKAEINNFKGD